MKFSFVHKKTTIRKTRRKKIEKRRRKIQVLPVPTHLVPVIPIMFVKNKFFFTKFVEFSTPFP